MKYNNIINVFFDTLETAAKAINDPMSITNKLGKSEILRPSTSFYTNNNSTTTDDNNIYLEDESNNIEYDNNVNMEDSDSYDKNNNYYNQQPSTASNPQGIIDSIAQELTSVRLQQAIILSEIVGKPKSKTRKRRRL